MSADMLRPGRCNVAAAGWVHRCPPSSLATVSARPLPDASLDAIVHRPAPYVATPAAMIYGSWPGQRRPAGAMGQPRVRRADEGASGGHGGGSTPESRSPRAPRGSAGGHGSTLVASRGRILLA